MALLLLPRLGVGNPVGFNNNFSVSKDGNPWSDGGLDTFDGTRGVEITTPNGWAMIGGNAYTAADGLIQMSSALGIGLVDVGIYAGWATSGIFVCEIELGHQPLDALSMRFSCNTGYDNGSPTGMVTKAFTIGSNDYELKTAWTTYGEKDSWISTGETQITVTIVPYLAEQNAPGANPFRWLGSGDDRDYRIDDVQRGATMYIQWGKVNVEAVQDWIIGDLVESEEFTASPHERMILHDTPPGVQFHSLTRVHSPCSERWNDGGGFAAQYRPVSASRRNIHFGGSGFIAGTVKEKGQPDQPLVRQVLLYSENTRTLVASTWSDAEGRYRFAHIDPQQRYTVVSYDHEGLYRAVIADRLSPEPMP